MKTGSIRAVKPSGGKKVLVEQSQWPRSEGSESRATSEAELIGQ